jgi:methylamine---glutamate N-methyltransferase subunit C
MEGAAMAQGAGVPMPVDAAGLEPWEAESRRRAKEGRLALFPLRDVSEYGHRTFGARAERAARAGLTWDQIALVPPLFTPRRFDKMVELGREPYFTDVDLATTIGGFHSAAPYYASAMGGTAAASLGGAGIAEACARRGLPLVLGENVATVRGYDKRLHPGHPSFKERCRAYADALPERRGGLVIQQSVEDADAELWNRVYSDPAFEPLLSTGRLGFELKCGQGAKPGLGGLTLVSGADARRLKAKFLVQEEDLGHGHRMRHSAPGTYTEEILRNQVRLMRNNYPRAKVWIKLPPTRDVDAAAQVAWEAGADAVTVDGAEGGSGLAPTAFLDHLGLPLLECLLLLGRPDPRRCLHVSGGFHEGSRVVKALCLGARAVGLGRALMAAQDAEEAQGVERFLDVLETELRMVVSALGKYRAAELDGEDLFLPRGPA